MRLEIKVKDKHFVSYIEICLQVIGSGVYDLKDDVFTLNVNPFTHLCSTSLSAV